MTDIEKELYHHGIKGMKWGRRRYQNPDGSLTPAGKKRYVTVAQANRNAKKAGQEARRASIAADKAAGVTGIGSGRKVLLNANAAEKKAVKESLAADRAYNKQLRSDKRKNSKLKNPVTREKAAKVAAKGAKVAGQLAMSSLVDDVFYGGAGKKVAKETTMAMGRAAVTAYTMARGGYDIKWYDKQGRRVG